MTNDQRFKEVDSLLWLAQEQLRLVEATGEPRAVPTARHVSASIQPLRGLVALAITEEDDGDADQTARIAQDALSAATAAGVVEDLMRPKPGGDSE